VRGLTSYYASTCRLGNGRELIASYTASSAPTFVSQLRGGLRLHVPLQLCICGCHQLIKCSLRRMQHHGLDGQQPKHHNHCYRAWREGGGREGEVKLEQIGTPGSGVAETAAWQCTGLPPPPQSNTHLAAPVAAARARTAARPAR
jgi:hypothetical protein